MRRFFLGGNKVGERFLLVLSAPLNCERKQKYHNWTTHCSFIGPPRLPPPQTRCSILHGDTHVRQMFVCGLSARSRLDTITSRGHNINITVGKWRSRTQISRRSHAMRGCRWSLGNKTSSLSTRAAFVALTCNLCR